MNGVTVSNRSDFCFYIFVSLFVLEFPFNYGSTLSWIFTKKYKIIQLACFFKLSQAYFTCYSGYLNI